MKNSGFFGMMVAFASFIRGLFRKYGSGWKRNKKGLMRETNPNNQRGCVHTVGFQPRGRVYAKGASGSIGRGLVAKFDRSAFCREGKQNDTRKFN